MEYRDYYKILQVDKSATEKDIKSAYRRLARKYHPDKNPDDPSAEEKFKEINEAYEVLGNVENRRKYDQLGQSYHRYRQTGGAPDGFDFSQWAAAGGPGGSYQQVNIDIDDLFGGGGGFSDFFDTIFGGGFRTQRQAGGDIFGRTTAQKPRALQQSVEITLEEAYAGTTRTFVSEDGERFTAKIPAGADNGTKIRLRGKGATGARGRGNLILNINVRPHSTFKREKNDLHVDVPVDIITAVLGGQVIVPTMSGNVKLTIPEGTQGGRTFRLTGKGMPLLREKEKYGDLYATVRLTVPEKLTKEQRELFEKLAILMNK